MITFSLEGKRALVTGAAQGIGYGVAEAFAAQGAAVAILDLDADQARDAAATLTRTTGTTVISLAADVSDPASVEAAVSLAATELGGLDVAVNNAGVGNATSTMETTDEEWRRVHDVNVDGVFYCCRAEGRWMLDNSVSGSIINTVSMSAVVSVPQHQTPYNSSKSAALGLTKSLANELAPAGIRVNSVSPGFTLTPMVKTERMRPQHELWSSLTPAGRLAEVEDLVGAYVFLASDASRFVIGHDLLIDGGYTLR